MQLAEYFMALAATPQTLGTTACLAASAAGFVLAVAIARLSPPAAYLLLFISAIILLNAAVNLHDNFGVVLGAPVAATTLAGTLIGRQLPGCRPEQKATPR